MMAWISATAESKTGEAESTAATASATRAISDGVERMSAAPRPGTEATAPVSSGVVQGSLSRLRNDLRTRKTTSAHR